MAEKTHLNITVVGRVQGVGFRYSASHEARSLGLAGFVQNRADGSVYIEAEGPPEDLAAFLAWCHEGPPTARVASVAQSEGSVVSFIDFEIRKGLHL